MLPQNAKKAYEGGLFTVYEREQKLFDNTTTTFSSVERPDTVKIIATVSDKIIMAEETQPHLESTYHGLLGGRKDIGETHLECAKRELLEETGMQAQNRKEFKKYSMPGKMIWNSYFFIAQNCEKIQEQKLDAGEKIQLYTLSFDEFLSFLIDKEDISFTDSMLIIDILKAKVNGGIENLKNKIFL